MCLHRTPSLDDSRTTGVGLRPLTWVCLPAPASKAEARRRYAYLNAGHVPDAFKLGDPHTLYEFKCYTPFHLNGTIGLGDTPSSTEGHTFAFSNTEVSLRVAVLGRAAHG